MQTGRTFAESLCAEVSNPYDAMAKKKRAKDDEYLTVEVSRCDGQADDVVRRFALLERQASVPTQGITNQKIVAFA